MRIAVGLALGLTSIICYVKHRTACYAWDGNRVINIYPSAYYYEPNMLFLLSQWEVACSVVSLQYNLYKAKPILSWGQRATASCVADWVERFFWVVTLI